MAYQTPAEAWDAERKAVQAKKDREQARIARREAFEDSLEEMTWHQRILAYVCYWLT